MFRTIFCLCLLGTVFGQYPFPGRCPKVRVKENFDLTKYDGRWYEYKRYFAVFQMFSTCVTAEYTLMDGGKVKVNNTGWDILNRRYFTAIGDAERTDETTDDAKLGVLFPGAPSRGNYWVLDTDYNTYTLIWSCSDSNALGYWSNSQNTWILSRDPKGVDDTVMERLENLIKQYNIARPYRITDQKKCPGRMA